VTRAPAPVEPAEDAAELAVAEAEPPAAEFAVEANGSEPGDAGEDPLPPVEALTARVPAGVAAAMDELFRVKWTGVRRVRPGDLKGD